MRTGGLKTKIFLDSGDPSETKKALDLLGFLDGQTTNPSLVSKNPEVAKKIQSQSKLSSAELLEEYKNIVEAIAETIPEGSVSIEVYSDKDTIADEMINQAYEMNSWIPNAHIKIPCTFEGLKAAKELISDGLRINITLVFSQEQAAAVHSISENSELGQVFISPFVGRLDDHCRDGMDLISNILKMYREVASPVEVLTASIRNVNHFLYSLYVGSDILTAPLNHIEKWVEEGKQIPGITIDDDVYKNQNEFFSETRDECIIDIDYKELELSRSWNEFNIKHELTDQGLAKFAADWNSLLRK